MPGPTANVFVTYSHRDSRHLERLRVHLRPLERDLAIDLWDDTRLNAGDCWREQIAKAIENAHIGILLVSADFLASDYISENELPPLLDAARERGLVVIPIVLGHCRLQSIPVLSDIQAVNDPIRPIATLPVAEREKIWVKVAERVEAARVGHTPSDGWRAIAERQLFDFMHRLSQSPMGSFLVITVGDYYVQFILEAGNTLYCEAVSNAYLSNLSQLSAEQIETLGALRFEAPTAESRNFSQAFFVDAQASQLPSIVSTVVTIFDSVYGVSHQSRFDFNLVEGG